MFTIITFMKQLFTVKLMGCSSFFLIAIMISTLVDAQRDSLAFGDKKWIDNGLKGEVFALPDTTKLLPDFSKMKPIGTVYTSKFDIPAREWTSGFPGIPDRNEWFGIVYTGSFKAVKKGNYIFRLVSDDGAKLYIDKKLVIDNDGLHTPATKLGTVSLDESKHSFRLEYFQGPRSWIVLQLFGTYENETEQVFPGPYFTLNTPAEKKAWNKYLIYAGLGLLLLIILWFLLRRKRRMPAD